jgi:hypothetical protein
VVLHIPSVHPTNVNNIRTEGVLCSLTFYSAIPFYHSPR